MSFPRLPVPSGRSSGSAADMVPARAKPPARAIKARKRARAAAWRPGFEGGQMPLQRRVPKRGFNNIFATRYAIVNLAALNKFENGAVVDTEALKAGGLVKNSYDGVKILGNGALEKNLTVKAAAFSESAKSKIEAAGGKAEVV